MQEIAVFICILHIRKLRKLISVSRLMQLLNTILGL